MGGASSLRLMIVDDEELARLRLRGLVQACTEPRAEVVCEAANAQQALAWLANHPCDALLLDIHMPGRDGLQLAAELRRQADAPAVVFVTAHTEHALRAFDLEAVDYLTKPVRSERLQAALQRIADRLAVRRELPPRAPDEAAAVLVVSERGRIVRVPVDAVLYLKAELKYVTLRTADHSYVLDDSLADLESRLGDRFLRVRRNALVARRAIVALERRLVAGEGDEEAGEAWAVRIAPLDEWIAVSRRQLPAVREAMHTAGL